MKNYNFLNMICVIHSGTLSGQEKKICPSKQILEGSLYVSYKQIRQKLLLFKLSLLIENVYFLMFIKLKVKLY